MELKFEGAPGLMRKIRFAQLLTLVLLVSWPVAVPAQETETQGLRTVSLNWENDLFSGTDRDYTNGLKLTYSRPYRLGDGSGHGSRGWADDVMDAFPPTDDPFARRAVSYSLGQNIYTPEDTRRSDLVEDDRPYAGYSYFGVGFHVREGSRRQVWEVDAGVVGPLSMGQEVQDFAHSISGSSYAEGWKHQLNNEPTLEVIWEGRWRFWHKDLYGAMGFDLIPNLTAQAGNVAILAGTGVEVRLGWHLPENFGSCPIRQGCDLSGLDETASGGLPPLGFNIFASVDGRMVLHDIFLDGNTFSHSHNVSKETFVGDLMTGVAMIYRGFRISYAFVFRTREFKEQSEAPSFGAINMVFMF